RLAELQPGAAARKDYRAAYRRQLRRRHHQPARARHHRPRHQARKKRKVRSVADHRRDSWPRHTFLAGHLAELSEGVVGKVRARSLKSRIRAPGAPARVFRVLGWEEGEGSLSAPLTPRRKKNPYSLLTSDDYRDPSLRFGISGKAISRTSPRTRCACRAASRTCRDPGRDTRRSRPRLAWRAWFLSAAYRMCSRCRRDGLSRQSPGSRP